MAEAARARSNGSAKLAAPAEVVPPHDLAVEEQLIADLLCSTRALPEVRKLLSGPGDFYRPAYARTYGAICALVDEGSDVDPITVADMLSRLGAPSEGLSRQDLVVVSANALAIDSHTLSHAKALADLAARRRAQAVGNSLSAAAGDLAKPLDEGVAEADAALATLVAQRQRARRFPIGELVRSVLDDALRPAEDGGHLVGSSSGYADLDEFLGGWRRGSLVLVGARPAMGKTAFAVGVTAHAALRGIPVLYVSAEMTAEQIGRRVLAAVAEVPIKALERRQLDTRQRARAERAAEALGQVTFEVLDAPGVGAADIRLHATAMQARGGLGLVVVDYLGLLRHEQADRNDLAVGQTAWALKVLARDLDVPVVLLSQLNRDLERRADKRETVGRIDGSEGVFGGGVGPEVPERAAVLPHLHVEARRVTVEAEQLDDPLRGLPCGLGQFCERRRAADLRLHVLLHTPDVAGLVAHMNRHAHYARSVLDGAADRLADPPCGVGRELDPCGDAPEPAGDRGRDGSRDGVPAVPRLGELAGPPGRVGGDRERDLPSRRRSRHQVPAPGRRSCPFCPGLETGAPVAAGSPSPSAAPTARRRTAP